jgi:hypothetical protein
MYTSAFNRLAANHLRSAVRLIILGVLLHAILSRCVMAQDKKEDTNDYFQTSHVIASWLPTRSEAAISALTKSLEPLSDGPKSLDELECGLTQCAMTSMRLPTGELLSAIQKTGADRVTVGMWNFRPGVPTEKVQITLCDGVVVMSATDKVSLVERIRALRLRGIQIVADETDSRVYEVIKEGERDPQMWLAFPRLNAAVIGLARRDIVEVLMNAAAMDKRKDGVTSWPAWSAEFEKSEFWAIRRDGIRLDGRTPFPSMSFASSVDRKRVKGIIAFSSELEFASFLGERPIVAAPASSKMVERALGVPLRDKGTLLGSNVISQRELTFELAIPDEDNKDGVVFVALLSNLGIPIVF